MVVNKTPKLAALVGFGIGGWLLPLAYPMSTPVTSFSLMLSAFSSTALALEVQRESLVSSVANTERRLDLERLAYEQSLRHQAELDRLRELYGFGDEDEDDRYEPQPALNGATIHQTAIGGAPGGNLWNLDQLLSSNSSHVLLIGQTGSGKTTLARWLIGQLNSGKTIVLDADDDGQTWQGFQVVGCGDNWTDIDTAMSQGLEDFHNRKPNGNNTQTVYVLEELPDLISECKGGVEFCNRILRRGRKRKMFVIGLTQDPNTGTIGLSQPTQKCFTRIYLGGMARYALTNLVPRNQRQALSSALSSCTRGSIVEFLGEWFVWDVPNLGSSTTPPQPQRQTIVNGGRVEESPSIAILDRALATSPAPETQHLQILDMARGSRDGFVSVRDVQRSLSISTAQEVKELFYQLQSLELGEIEADKLPNGSDRVLFRAYPPMP